MKNLRPFQIALLAGFLVIALVAIVVLSAYDPQPSAAELRYGQQVEIWGTLDAGVVNNLFLNITQENQPFNVVQYTQIDERTFDDEFVNAIAEGRSPDMIILPSDKLVTHRAKLQAIPYEEFPLRNFRDLYVDGAEIFALRDGIYAVPFAVDPLLLYWNRDLFASAGLAQAPQYWETVVASVVPSITVRTDSRDIITSGIAFGEYRNVTNAKDILLMLAIQSGSALVSETDRGYRVSLNDAVGDRATSPLTSALRFFTDFSNVNNPLYSWNRVQPSDTQAFIAGDLALYFGRASEVQSVSDKNPNLNFDTAVVPQGGTASVQRTHGTFYGFAFPRAAQNTSGAYNAALTISESRFSDQLTTALNMAPVRREVIAAGSNNPFRAITLRSALFARTWLDPDAEASDSVFQQMVEDVVSNRSRLSNAVSDAIQRLVLEY